ncbi:MAG TPA: glycoside hydrolase family 16 protein, partial [Acidimicrobiales bacterium]
SGQQWTCSFDSEFTGTTLNTSQWTVQQTSSSGYTDGPANNPPCFVDNPNNVSVGGGYLTLTVRQVAPFTCTKPLGSFRANYTAGEVTSYFKWSQEYGLFEVRAKLPTASVSGLLDTLWLYPSEERLYGGGGASGEIDFAEWWSQYPNWDIPVIHYNNQIGDPNSTTHCDITPGQFNVYGVEWTPLNITILVNGSVCLQDDWDPLPPQTKPEPFNQPFTINLTQALAPSGFSSSTPLPASLEVQWVRVWTENGS